MAKGTKELKRRITGVRNIQQITRAMEMVATQKLKRLQSRAEAARPFSEKIQQMVGRLAASVRPELSPLLQPREVKVTANLVVSADKGLCGAYNANLLRLAQAEIPRGAGDRHRTRVLGSKGTTLLRVRGIALHGSFEDQVEKLDFTRVRHIARDLVSDFTLGHVDEVRVLYTAFLSAASQKPVCVTLLPIRPEELVSGAAAAATDVLIEPSPDELLKQLLPKYVEVKLYSAVLESLASEFTARRNAMKQATDAADEMIGALRRQYNRARQETITKELLEVVSGAEALK
ncbi:MAG: ATP synthase F1 subunit gamma [Planctomycetes bacterium]|nr:ATP synthase F1 subunit gamma [Planctomycetota bacterium]